MAFFKSRCASGGRAVSRPTTRTRTISPKAILHEVGRLEACLGNQPVVTVLGGKDRGRLFSLAQLLHNDITVAVKIKPSP